MENLPSPVQSLRRHDLSPDPFVQFDRWFSEAIASGVAEPTAMTLATATPDGRPSARTVLLKEYGPEGFVFFTNYQSRKARELDANPEAALLFHWPALGRQIRITGTVSRTTLEESERYFATRPEGSRLGAWASAQSEPIASRGVLEERLKRIQEQFRKRPIPLPPFWGGYRVRAGSFEFWQAGVSRLHDRFRYTPAPAEGGWRVERLSP